MRTPGPSWSNDFSLPHSVIVINPLQRPSPRLTATAAASGAIGVLELPVEDPRETVDLLDRTCRWSSVPFGVRVREGCSATAGELPELVDTVLLADPGRSPAEFADLRVLVEVTCLAQALSAAEAGAAGLIVRGSESGGRAGELSTFVLLQQVLAEPALDLPVWACGGIGPHTAAAAVAGGAAGVVLDTQLALFDEAGLPTELAGVLAGLDGSETVLHHGTRVLRRRGPGVPELPSDQAEFAARIGTDDLRTQFVPLGQDAFLAASFADRWTTVAEAVRGVASAMADAFADDAPAAALAAGSAGARTGHPTAHRPGADDARQRRARLRGGSRGRRRSAVPRARPGERRPDPIDAAAHPRRSATPSGASAYSVSPTRRSRPRSSTSYGSSGPRTRSSRAAGRPTPPRWRRRASRPSCMCRPPGCCGSSWRRARAGSSSRAPSAAAMSGRATASRCGRHRPRSCSNSSPRPRRATRVVRRRPTS